MAEKITFIVSNLLSVKSIPNYLVLYPVGFIINVDNRKTILRNVKKKANNISGKNSWFTFAEESLYGAVSNFNVISLNYFNIINFHIKFLVTKLVFLF